jgi:hypothetical protein
MYCGCTSIGQAKSDSGYAHRSDDLWVHAKCRMPTKMYLEAFMAKQQAVVLTHLNLLQGGPLHNEFLRNDELIDRVALGVRENGAEILKHIDRYRWTPETLTGQSGRTARIWRYKED